MVFVITRAEVLRGTESQLGVKGKVALFTVKWGDTGRIGFLKFHSAERKMEDSM